MTEQGVECGGVTVCAEAEHHSEADRAQDAVLAERFAGVDIAQVGLDDRQCTRDDGVSQCDRIMGERPRVEDHPVGPAPGVVECVDQDTLVVGLDRVEFRRGLAAILGGSYARDELDELFDHIDESGAT